MSDSNFIVRSHQRKICLNIRLNSPGQGFGKNKKLIVTIVFISIAVPGFKLNICLIKINIFEETIH